MFVVKFTVDGTVEDQNECDTEKEALLVASEWAGDARREYQDSAIRYDVDVTVEEVTLIAQFPLNVGN